MKVQASVESVAAAQQQVDLKSVGPAVVVGTVEHGDERGTKLGFPTANLSLRDVKVPDGVWAAVVEVGSQLRAIGAVSIGHRPTFYTRVGERLLEAHLLDFKQDIYGQQLRVELFTRLRAQRKFCTIKDLIEQLQRDVDATRAWGTSYYPSLLSSKALPSDFRSLT